MIEIRDLYAGYGGGDILKGISFAAQRGECLCVLGPNGCGKSTLLKAIARIIEYRGTIQCIMHNAECRIEDAVCDIAVLPRKELAKKIALLGQNAQLLFPYTVYETVSLGRYAYTKGFLKNLSGEDREIIEQSMKQLDIWDIKNRMIDELSGGQLQRVFLAKTLAQTPDIIMLDEPTNHLDLKNQIELMRYLKQWVKENNKILISVFHDLNMVRHFGDTAALIHGGTVAAYGEAGHVLNSETLKDVYGMDIRAFMAESLGRWS